MLIQRRYGEANPAASPPRRLRRVGAGPPGHEPRQHIERARHTRRMAAGGDSRSSCFASGPTGIYYEHHWLELSGLEGNGGTERDIPMAHGRIHRSVDADVLLLYVRVGKQPGNARLTA